jgi:hypothetical protein
MAQLTLITGVPGDGKSLLAITKGLAFVAEGRTVYAAGFKELDYAATGFLPLPTPFENFDKANRDDNDLVKPDWMLLEGAVIIYDECYSVIPSRAVGKPVPVHIEALARHRHYNIDLIFVTQKHDQIDNFVRGLVKEHIHVKRKFGFNGAVLRTWDAFQINTDKKADSAPLWPYPKKNYSLYKSATAHTIKKRIPWFIWAPIPLIALLVGMLWYVKAHFGKPVAAPVTVASATGAGVGAGAALTPDAGRAKDDALRRRDYPAWMRPRVAGQPWTAPAYDQLQPQGVPDLYCIAVDDGRCECRTEQGTRYVIEPRVCRVIASEGIYNPFRKPLDVRGADRRSRDDEEQGAKSLHSDVQPQQGLAGTATGLQRGV